MGLEMQLLSLASAGHGPYIRAIARKPLELPPEVADAFVADSRALWGSRLFSSSIS